jgi:spore maturation protein CgeB
VKIIYSYNKKGFEAEYWQREIAAASDERNTFIPFNHDSYLDANSYIRAQLLDNFYYDRHPGLMRMYADLEALIGAHGADALIVDNCFPYHPDYLKTLRVYKVLRTSDGPITAYDRDFAYVHAYDHVLYHSPAYSRDMGMAEKLRYVGAREVDFWPFALWDAWSDPSQTEESLFSRERDIEIIFIGYPHLGKLPFMAKVKKAFGNRLLMIGFKPKYNVYFNVKYGFPGYVRPPIRPGAEFLGYYRRTQIGINIHNRGDYTVGNYRMFELPASGVMQISDGGEYLDEFFKVGEEIVGYRDADDLIDKVRYYLVHDEERRRIARNGFRRVMKDHRFPTRMHQAGLLIEKGRTRAGWTGAR